MSDNEPGIQDNPTFFQLEVASDSYEELKRQGWETVISFHGADRGDWRVVDKAIDPLMTKSMKEDWHLVRANPSKDEDPLAYTDGVQYILKKPTELREKWNKEQGYSK